MVAPVGYIAWFGMAIFFSLIVGLTIFGTLQPLAERESDERPLWLPLPALFDQNPTIWEDPTGLVAIQEIELSALERDWLGDVTMWRRAMRANRWPGSTRP